MYPYTYSPGPEAALLAQLQSSAWPSPYTGASPYAGASPPPSPPDDPTRELLLQIITQDRRARQQAAFYEAAQRHHAARHGADARLLASVLSRASAPGSDPVDYLRLLGADPAFSSAAPQAVIPSMLLAQVFSEDPDASRARAAEILANVSGLSQR